jgi:hypothetical protein
MALFAFDLSGTCALEAARASEAPDEATAWAPIDVSNRRLEIRETGEVAAKKPDGSDATFVVLRLADGRWVRLAGGPPGKSPLTCAVDTGRVETLATPIRATTVRLKPTAGTCHGLHPLTGSQEDVTFEPYTVLARRIYRVQAGVEAGVTLRGLADGKLVTVPADEFNSCFANTSRAPLPPGRGEALLGWVTREAREASPLPAEFALDDALMTLGIDEASCLRDGQPPALHRECRAPAIGFASDPHEQGGKLLFMRERLLDSVQGRGDALVSPEDAVSASIVVMPPRGAHFPLVKAFDAALGAAVSDPVRQHRRAMLGYRILRSSDASTAITPTANVESELSLALGDVQEATEAHRTTRTGAKADLPNPEYARLTARASRAQAALDVATREATTLAALFSVAAPDCSRPDAGVICDGDAPNKVADALRGRQQALTNAVAFARDAVAKTRPTIPGEATESVEFAAKAFRRPCEVKLKVNIMSREAGGGSLGSAALSVPFTTVSLDIPGDPAHGIEARKGGPPTEEEIEHAAAEAIVARIDELLSTWMSRSTPRVDAASLEPGTRAYQALLGRHVASNRRVRLFSDVLDFRGETLDRDGAAAASPRGAQDQGEARYPVQLDGTSGAKCFTFVAATPDAAPVDINLTLTTASGALLARDKRPVLTAGFEVCGLEPGAYTAAVTWGGGKPRGVFLSVFESTPGAITDADQQAATAGAAPMLGKPPPPALPPPAAPAAPAAAAPAPPPPAPAAPAAAKTKPAHAQHH